MEPLSANGTLRPGVEMLLRKLESMDEKLLDLQNGQDALQRQMTSIKASFEKTSTDLSILQNQTLLILEQQTVCISLVQSYEKVLKTFSNESNNATISTPATPTPSRATTRKSKEPPFSSCKDVPYNVSGVYPIRVNNDSTPFNVFCEQEKFGGGWIVVQHRFDGSVDFYRNWTEYRDGFGNLENEFWLGLEKIHHITTDRPHEIIFEMKDFNDNYGYARYDEFKIDSEHEQYRLTIGNYSGNVRDSMSYNKGMKFSTKERDNDNYYRHCANDFEGAWWYVGCTLTNLNGPYKNVNDQKSMYWYYFKNDYRGMSFSRMMMRES